MFPTRTLYQPMTFQVVVDVAFVSTTYTHHLFVARSQPGLTPRSPTACLVERRCLVRMQAIRSSQKRKGIQPETRSHPAPTQLQLLRLRGREIRQGPTAELQMDLSIPSQDPSRPSLELYGGRRSMTKGLLASVSGFILPILRSSNGPSNVSKSLA